MCDVAGGLLLQSRFRVQGKAVFAPDADFTTLTVDLLEAWCSLGGEPCIAGLPDAVAADVVRASLPHLVEDAASPWHLHVLDHAVAIVEGDAPLLPALSGDDVIVMEPAMHEGLEDAWREECSSSNVSQGAYVSDRTHRLGMTARLALAAQVGPTWPPRGADHNGQVLAEGGNLVPFGSVYSWTRLVPAGAPSEFALRAPLLGGLTSMVVELDDGPRGVFLHADGHESVVDIGRSVRLVVRRLYAQDGVLRYGRKALS